MLPLATYPEVAATMRYSGKTPTVNGVSASMIALLALADVRFPVPPTAANGSSKHAALASAVPAAVLAWTRDVMPPGVPRAVLAAEP
jgi:hypothetical protein